MSEADHQRVGTNSHGLYSRDLADPDCGLCGGRGKVQTGDNVSDLRLCTCVLDAVAEQAASKSLDRMLADRARAMTLDSFVTGDIERNQQVLDVARNFVTNFERAREEGWFVTFYGEPRAGKTHLAVGIAQGCVVEHSTSENKVETQLLNLPKAFAAERNRISEGGPSPFKQAEKVDLLIVDDFGAQYEAHTDDERVSWQSDLMYDLLDTRFIGQYPTIFTTNLTPSDLERRFTSETWLRVFHRMMSGQVIPPMEVFRVPNLNSEEKAAARRLINAPR